MVLLSVTIYVGLLSVRKRTLAVARIGITRINLILSVFQELA